MTSPFFSIIITSRNYGVFLRDCLNSVYSQFCTDYELIGVNVGSTDNTHDIFSKAKNCLYLNAERSSQVIACYEGLKRAKGKYVLFLDGDDMIFSITLKIAKEYLITNYVKLQYPLTVFFDKPLPKNLSFPRFPRGYNSSSIKDSFSYCGTYIWPVTSGNIYRKDFLDKCFPLQKDLPVDGQLNTIAPCFGEIATIPFPLGYYRQHLKSASSRKLYPYKPENFRIVIRRRLMEYFWARKKAKQKGLFYPMFNLLNYELYFITYRAILKKTGSPFLFDKNLGFFFFFFCVLRIAIKNLANRYTSIASFIWILGLLILPRHFVNYYVSHRFGRNYRRITS